MKPGDENAEGRKKDLAPGEEGAAAATKEDRFAAPRYDWRKSPYVSRLFGSRLKDEEKRQIVHFGHELFAPGPTLPWFSKTCRRIPGTSSAPATNSSSGCGAGWRGPSG